jgi:tetratricopeptide (TPR) repeat protein
MADHLAELPITFEKLCEVAGRFPDWHKAQYAMGIAYAQRNLLREATKFLRIAAELKPDFAEGRHTLGGALLFQNDRIEDFVEAEEHFRVATNLKPEWLPPLDGLARALRYQNKHAEEVAVLERLIGSSPESAQYQRFMALALYHLGDTAKAETHMRRAVELDPNFEAAKRDLDDMVAARRPKARRTRFVRYPEKAAEFSDVEQVARRHLLAEFNDAKPILFKDTEVVATGSCFALHMGKSLSRKGLNVVNFTIGEQVNSTFANLELLKLVLLGEEGPNVERIEELFWQNDRAKLKDAVSRGAIFVYSLGVAPCFFDVETGQFVMPRSSQISLHSLTNDYKFRTTTVQENVDNIRDIIATVRTLNSEVPVVLTLSPVPIHISFEFASAIAADCVSKSVLRVAANEVVNSGIPGVIYWPSFEMVRWVGSHTGPVFGTEDGNTHHVSSEVVDMIMGLFVDYFGSDELKLLAPEIDLKAQGPV